MIGNIVAGTFSAGVAPVTSSYESIATAYLSGGSNNTIEFTTIPSTYKHLQIRVMSPSGSYSTLRFNNDTTTSNYRNHYIVTVGSGTPSAGSNANNAYFPNAGGWTTPYAGIMDILDYSSTSKYKTIRILDGTDSNGGGELYLSSCLWMDSTNAISSIKLVSQVASFGQYTHAALYGIKD